MFDFVEFDIDDERSEFLRSLAYRGSCLRLRWLFHSLLFVFCFRLCGFLALI